MWLLIWAIGIIVVAIIINAIASRKDRDLEDSWLDDDDEDYYP
jgi:beta-lactamase regulating signal transducer with metallopeptidase domain